MPRVQRLRPWRRLSTSISWPTRRLAPGTIAHVYVTACAEVETGAWPLALPGYYSADSAHLAAYAEEARTMDGFGRYLSQHVLGRAAA